MPSIIQIPESRLISVIDDGDRIVLAFNPFCIIKSEGVPAVDASTRWSQLGELVIHEPQIESTLEDLPVTLTGGRIAYAGYTYIDMIPMPLDSEPAAHIRLDCAAGTVEIRGVSISLDLIGDGSYIEHIKA